MKVNPKFLIMMAALAAGTASAATAGTTAGTIITNTATASFTDPNTGNAATPVVSNTVSTTVTPITGFDVVYSDGSADDTSATAPAPTYDKTNVIPGSTVATTYTVLNNSNINGYVVNLTADTTGSTNTLPTTNVKYYAAGTTSFVAANEITRVTLTNGGSVGIIQVITIPSNAAAGQKFSASPKGTAPASTDTAAYPTAPAAGAFAAYLESSNVNPPATASVNGDLQYTRATVYTPVLTETPSAPAGNTVTPPTAANPGTPDNPVSPPGTPADPADPNAPGYTDPTQTPTAANPGTAISVNVAGNSQTAYPPTGVTKVTFTNQVNNGTALADTVKLFPTDAGGLPIGTNNNDGTFTLPNGAIVKFLDNAGNPLPLTTGPDGNKYPSLATPAAVNGVATPVKYRTEVSNVPISATDPVPTVVLVGISSGNKGGAVAITADATTTDTILPPGLQFGDVTATAPGYDRALIGPGNVAQVVDPGQGVSPAPVRDAGVNNDRTAVFPMVIRNTGEYNDTYALTETSILVKNTAGGSTSAPFRYYGADGFPLNQDSVGNFVTGVIAPNSSVTVYAVVFVPTNAAATNGTTTGTNPDIVFTQTVKANYGQGTATDINSQITVNTVGSLTVNKYQGVNAAAVQDATGQTARTAAPRDTINYAIVAKSSYNTPVKNFILKDSNTGSNTNVYTFADYQSASVTLTGFAPSARAYFSNDAGVTWTLAAPTTVTPANGIWVAVDTDSSGTITSADVVPALASIQLNIVVKVK